MDIARRSFFMRESLYYIEEICLEFNQQACNYLQEPKILVNYQRKTEQMFE